METKRKQRREEPCKGEFMIVDSMIYIVVMIVIYEGRRGPYSLYPPECDMYPKKPVGTPFIYFGVQPYQVKEVLIRLFATLDHLSK